MKVAAQEHHTSPIFTALCCFLQDPTDDSIFRELYLQLMSADQDNFPATTLSGLQRVCSINYGFIALPENVMPLLKSVNCSIVPLPYKTYPISLAMAFSPRSPYKDFWNYRQASVCVPPTHMEPRLWDMSFRIPCTEIVTSEGVCARPLY
jgi:hypothetical protein